MSPTIRSLENPQPDLFDQDAPRVELTPAQRGELTAMVTALLLEIAVALATGEAGDDQDHR